ncbi:MAG: hypothetical protein FJW86_09030 [Actinobacteria bacterium]|nr:hypothetical protein [Actinomycetota bacterium]
MTGPPTPAAADESIDWRACVRGALLGLAVIVPTTIVRVVLDRELDDFDDSGWVYPLFLLILAGYFAAGWVASRDRPATPLIHGTIAGVGVLIAWIPIRVIIWAIREDDRGLFSGREAALRPGQIFGHLMIAATLGMLGALVGQRLGQRGQASDLS